MAESSRNGFENAVRKTGSKTLSKRVRKRCGKRRNCSLRAISPFSTAFFKDLERKHVKTGDNPHSSVGSVADLRTGSRWFDPRLGQYSFRGLMTVIATFLFTAVRYFDIGYVGKQPVAWKEYCAEYWLKESRKAYIGALATAL